VRAATELGYRFALDDVVTTAVEGFADMLAHVEIVKIDLLDMTDRQIGDLTSELRRMSPHTILLAEKVETRETFEMCRRLGFSLFQGYFFAKPEVISRTGRPISHHAALVLMTAVQDPSITVEELAALADSDPTLAYRLLRLVNASATGLLTSIDTVRRAIVYLGIDQVRQLATLLAMSATSTNNGELITLALTRAHMARDLLADRPDEEAAFMAGLLSVIDVLFGTPMAELLDEVQVIDEVRHALLSGAGPIGEVLAAIAIFERADAGASVDIAGLDMVRLGQSFAAAAVATARLELQLHVTGP
jgi:EAL and modified HD-GYP domain-containing signal transduction protein